eukprot:CAMPEP_0183354208 /NCGR_PEP_ID=MMETSP0164_2-20130417/37176_1 /TAXON_ID=221442 /ORGANISM="Coccolithus pelagicus ssp braarudi, Strain PLY182g" /LENGTH=297 /DNA_ID=CAMNT_0025527057 /DNA_START=164 /DNA_END=1057 /DNA_ORIENTATION=+
MASVPEPRLSAEHLLTRASGFGNTRSALKASLHSPLDGVTRDTFERFCGFRLRRMPVQYILGDWDFHELTLRVEEPVLIPRPETEELVEHVLDSLRHKVSQHSSRYPLRILDIGCGTGAIGLALMNKLPMAHCTAIDISEQAVALSKHNAEVLRLADRYEAACVGIAEYAAHMAAPIFDVVVSNPPYIPQADMSTLAPEVVRYEDRRSLCGGDDGLDVVRQIVQAAPRLLRAEGTRSIWLEVDSSHPARIERWLGAEQPELQTSVVRSIDDVCGLPRFCHLQHSASGKTRTLSTCDH